MKVRHFKLLILFSLILLIAGFYAFGLDQYLSLDYFKGQQADLQRYVVEKPLMAMAGYFLVVFLLSALSLPGISIVIVVAGLTFFNFWTTLIVASFADTLGSTAAFLTSRYLFAQSLHSKYPDQLSVINRGIEQDGGFYLFSLRLMFFFPCFLINLLMGLTTLRTLTFYWVTQVGKLPYKAIFTYTGTELGKMSSPVDLLSPQLVLGFTLIGFFPLLSKKALQGYKQNRSHRDRDISPEEEKTLAGEIRD